MFRATSCSSLRESIVSIQRMVYVTLCMWLSVMQVRMFLHDLRNRRPHTQSDMYTRRCIDTIDSPDDEHEVARNMWRIEINI
jgi:hypothetical protein